jgi:hypothetical protein
MRTNPHRQDSGWTPSSSCFRHSARFPLDALSINMSTSDPPPRACQECNRKKVKCDMIRPVCGLCRRTSNDCHFPLRRKSSAINKTRLSRQSRAFQKSMIRLAELLESNPPVVDQVQQLGLVNPAGSPSLGTLQSSTRPNGPSHDDHHNRLSQPVLSESNNQTSSSLLNTTYAPQNAPGVSSTSPRTDETYETPGNLVNLEISYSEAMFLIKMFFERIQPWLPILHEPRFRKRYSEQLSQKSNCLDGLAIDEKLLLCCIFTLGANAVPSGSPSTYPIVDRTLLSQFSRQIYAEARDMETPTLQYLQGCVLLAFALYTSGLSAQGWILVGVCVRLAYELALFEIDDPDNPAGASGDWVEVEEMRRAWWLVWELDTFGSSVCRKPFAVNRQQFMVKLPISDHLWFNEQPCSSSVLRTCPRQAWKSLKDCENQSERAWFLIANHLMATACDYYTRNRGVSAGEKFVLENDINCLRLSLPSHFNIVTGALCSNPTNSAENNWILGTHLFLTSATYMAAAISVDDWAGPSSPLSGSLSLESATTAWAFSI